MSPRTIVLYLTRLTPGRESRKHKWRKIRVARFIHSYEPIGAVFAGAHGNYAKLRGGWKRSLAPEHESYVEFEAFDRAVRAHCGFVARSGTVRFFGGGYDF